MDWRRALYAAPLAAILIGVVAGIAVVERDLQKQVTRAPLAASDGGTVVLAQAAGGLGVVVPSPPGQGAPLDPLTAEELALRAIAAQQGQSRAPLVDSLASDPNALLDVMRMVRQDPSLRAEALDRIRRSGLGGALTDEALASALDSLTSDPDRLRGILGQIGNSPQLLQGMLGQMGMPDVSEGQVRLLMQRLGQDPNLLARLAAGDAGVVDGLADELAGLSSGGQPDMGLPLGGLRGGSSAFQPGLPGPMGGLGGLGDLGAVLGQSVSGTEMLGTGASLSLLSDMLAGFGGADTAQLQNALRAGDISALLGLFNQLYGPTGSLSSDPDLGGGTIGSYTDLLDALMGME